MTNLKGLAKVRYQQILEFIKNKDEKELEKVLYMTSSMTMTRSCACYILDPTTYSGDKYYIKEDELTDEINALFKANGIKDRVILLGI